MKKFKDYFETPISNAELYKASKKSDYTMSKIAYKRKTGKNLEREPILNKELLREEFIESIKDLKNNIHDILKKIDSKKMANMFVLDSNSAFIEIEKILPDKFIKLLNIDYLNLDDSIDFIKMMTQIDIRKIIEKTLPNSDSRSKIEEIITDLMEEAIKILDITNSFELKNFIIKFDIEDNHRIHFKIGIPKVLKGFGFGKKLYLALAYRLKFIFSKPDASVESKQVWASLLTSEDNFYAFYNSKSGLRGILYKEASKQIQNKFVNYIVQDLISNYKNKDRFEGKIKNKVFKDQYIEIFKEEPPKNFKIDTFYSRLKKEYGETSKFKALKTSIYKKTQTKITKMIAAYTDLIEDMNLYNINSLHLKKYKEILQILLPETIDDVIADPAIKEKIKLNFL